MIGEFEYLLLASILRLGEDAYGVTIRLDIEKVTGRRCSIGAVYTTLDRLESKNFIKTWMGEATAQRGGRPKRMAQATAQGIKAAKDFYTTVLRATRGVGRAKGWVRP